MMYAIISELLQSTASPSGVALGSVIAICTMTTRIVSTRYKTRAGIIAAETALLVSQSEQERLMLVTTREQDRLDRAAEAELKFAQLTRRMKAEPDSQHSTVPAVQPKPRPAQVETRAA
jgi:hypothetical protein